MILLIKWESRKLPGFFLSISSNFYRKGLEHQLFFLEPFKCVSFFSFTFPLGFLHSFLLIFQCEKCFSYLALDSREGISLLIKFKFGYAIEKNPVFIADIIAIIAGICFLCVFCYLSVLLALWQILLEHF